MSYSECDRFLVSLYYAYGCALLTKGSSEVRGQDFPSNNGRHLYTTSCPLPTSSFLTLSPLPLLLTSLHHHSSFLTSLLSCPPPLLFNFLLFSFPLFSICLLLSFPSLLSFSPFFHLFFSPFHLPFSPPPTERGVCSGSV